MIVCPECKMPITDSKTIKCPRCNKLVKEMKKCEDCKGCSVLTLCKKE